ncbi:MAG: DNA-3-methyladenine glycosylase 2 family protein [Chloroflexota bacterium]|nr:DNA-3-methyladenine glycosylase 2 family protein [Chloroflexota bacterium]
MELRAPLDLGTTLRPLAHGRGDTTIRLRRSEGWLAFHTTAGPATLRLLMGGPAVVTATAWGDGAERALEGVPALVGELDRPEGFVAYHPILRRLQRSNAGLRLPRTGRVFAALLPTVIEQKVTGTEAFRAYAAILRRYGSPAPGPVGSLRLQPAPQRIATLPYHAFHPLGLERKRADVIRHAATRASWLEAAADAAEATRRLVSLPGIGHWTAAEVVRVAFGDPDAVSVGDYHVPNMVAWALAGEPRADDTRMLELLEPYRGQRGRVQRYLEVGAVVAPRYGPRMAPRRIAAI